jgi:hypothetical protein
VVKDVSLYANNGTVNGATWTGNGKRGGAYQFNGTTNYISITNPTGLPSGNSPRTLAIRFKKTVTNDTTPAEILGYGNNSNGQRFALMVDNGTWVGQKALGAECVNGASWFPWTFDTNWHQLVAVVPNGATNCNQVLIYFDGVQKTTTTSSVAINTVSSPLEIGKMATNSFYFS